MGADDLLPQGTPVRIRAAGGVYAAQVMFRHCGDPNRYLVAWLGDAPTGTHPIADWVDASQVALQGDEAGTGSGGVAHRQN